MYYMHMSIKQNINNKQMLKIRCYISISVSASQYNRDSKTRQRWPNDFFNVKHIEESRGMMFELSFLLIFKFKNMDKIRFK